jgi:hypothetical protein
MRLYLKFVCIRVVVLVALLGLSQSLGQVSDNQPRTAAKQISRTSKQLLVPKANGTVQKLLVEIADWSFSKDETEFDLPAGVSTIMTVLNGRVSVVIAGVSKEYVTGNYWSAAAGAHMSIAIQAPARGAILRTIITVPTK